MTNDEKVKQTFGSDNEDAAIQPDPETLHKTDPQDNMKGPISSLMQGIKENFEEEDEKVEKLPNDLEEEDELETEKE